MLARVGRGEISFAQTLARARRRDVRVLRGTAHGERPAGHPSRVRAHDQGSLLPPPRHEGILTCRARRAGTRTAFPSRSRSRSSSASAASATSRRSASRSSTGSAARACWTYKGEWEQLSARIGYWLDYSDPYVTYSNDYVESVWWALATLYEQRAARTAATRSCRTARAAGRRSRVTRWRRATRTSRIRASTSRSSSSTPTAAATAPTRRAHPRLDDHAVDARVERRRSRCIPTLEYVELARRERQRGDRHPRRGARARGARRGLRGSLGCGRARCDGRELVGLRYRRPLDWLPYPGERRARGDRRRGLRARPTTAPAWCTWRRRSAPTTTQPGSGTGSRSCSR